VSTDTVLFKGTVTDPDGDTVKLQVELRRLDEFGGNFDDTQGGLKESGLVSSGSEATCTANGLITGSYHWRARAIDEHGRESNWVDFGGNALAEADFTIPPTDITPPALIQDFTASDGEDSQSALSWTNPPDSDLNQVVVKRKTTGYPSDHADGDTRITIDAATPGREETFVDGGLTNGQYYYYAIFSCDSAGNWKKLVMEGKNRDIGNPRRLGDGKENKYAFILCGDRQGDFTASADDMRSALATWWYIPPSNITLCNTRDLAAQDLYACNDAIGDKIQAWIQNCKMDSDDMAIFYYAGHGEEGGEGIDPMCERVQGYIMYRELRNFIGGYAGTTIIILDTCYSGCAITGTANHPDNNLKGPDRWLLTACNECEKAQSWCLPGTELTAFMRFTRNLIRAMSWEDPSIAGSDNLISLQEAFGYADKRCNQKNPVLSLKGKGWQDPQIWPAEGKLVVLPQRGKPEAHSSLFFGLLCPVDLSVIDPMGRRVSLDTNEIGDSAFYVEADLNGDGENDIFCNIYAPIMGEYFVQVVPLPGASPTDTFTLLIGLADSVITIAREIQVADIPDEPYRIAVTEEGIELVGGVCSSSQFINHGPNPVPAEGCIFWLNLADDSVSATLKIFDLDGALLVSISLDPTADRYPAAGRWIPEDDQGRLLGTGLYLYLVEIEHTDGSVTYSPVQKMVIQR
jgi:hypothetical protein